MYKVTRQLCEKASGPSICVSRSQSYVGTGLQRVENRRVTNDHYVYYVHSSYQFRI